MMNINRTRRPATLKGSLTKAIARSVLFISALGVTMTFGGTDPQVIPLPSPDQVTPSSSQVLLAKHADTCWTGSQSPKAELPGAALVQLKGKTFHTSKHSLVDAAFNEVLTSAGYADFDNPNLEVIALCI